MNNNTKHIVKVRDVVNERTLVRELTAEQDVFAETLEMLAEAGDHAYIIGSWTASQFEESQEALAFEFEYVEG